jgi:sensor histidine kinase YesM
VPDLLELPYTQNHLRFEFTGIDLRNPEGVKFRWRLVGFETDWVPENSERQATYSNLQPGDYTFQVQAKNSDGYWSDLKTFAFHITPPVWQTWSFRLGVGGGILLLLFILFRWRLKLAQRRGKELLQKVRLEKHVLELEQKALRLQMNPHFIFNALQSINGYIARNDSAEARKYLAKFGKLMRMTLENSRTSYTSIEQEAELLYNYTALEAMSQGNRFTTHIDIDEQIRHESTFIPVMLVQPFVENAIIHGLKHKIEGGGELHVRFRLEGKPNGTNGDQQYIVCEIQDNGVGRKKAAEYEAGIKKDHKSAALEITRERLQQMNEEGKPKSSVEIIDVEDAAGEALGTKVVIRIGNVVFE